MAKRKKGSEGGMLTDVAEGLGTILGRAEAQWRAQRHSMVASLTAVRDKANALLAELGAGKPPPPSRAARAVKAVKSAVRKVGRRKFTAAQKAETSRRMKAFWAARRKASGK